MTPGAERRPRVAGNGCTGVLTLPSVFQPLVRASARVPSILTLLPVLLILPR